MSLLNLGTTYQYLIKGFVLLMAVCFDIASKKKKGA
jgi:ABC-type xylose transport system permease subunit